MKVLVIGSGGREHALAWKINKSDRVDQVFLAPGNGGTEKEFTNVDIGVDDFDGLIKFAKEEAIDLVVVGPEAPLADGIVDLFQEEGIKIFGPDKKCAEFESSKDFTKDFLNRHGIRTAKSFTTEDYGEAVDRIKDYSYPLVIKADGLCAGKGVIIAQSFEEADKALKDMLEDKVFGESGSKVLVEEFLEGDEASLICFVSNNKIIPMQTARDYKKIYEGDKGPNTGGVGVFSPSPKKSEAVQADIDDCIEKIEKGLEADGFNYYGILFIGFMIEGDQAKVLEFNVRFGDPETEVLLPRLESDLFEIMEKCLDGELEESDLVYTDDYCLGVVLHSKGYPGSYEKGYLIKGIKEELGEDELIFHNGTALKDGDFYTAGGRVLTLIGRGESLDEAREKAYELVSQVQCENLDYRKDIGKI